MLMLIGRFYARMEESVLLMPFIGLEAGKELRAVPPENCLTANRKEAWVRE